MRPTKNKLLSSAAEGGRGGVVHAALAASEGRGCKSIRRASLWSTVLNPMNICWDWLIRFKEKNYKKNAYNFTAQLFFVAYCPTMLCKINARRLK